VDGSVITKRREREGKGYYKEKISLKGQSSEILIPFFDIYGYAYA
jgi:hypothetical protein